MENQSVTEFLTLLLYLQTSWSELHIFSDIYNHCLYIYVYDCMCFIKYYWLSFSLLFGRMDTSILLVLAFLSLFNSIISLSWEFILTLPFFFFRFVAEEEKEKFVIHYFQEKYKISVHYGSWPALQSGNEPKPIYLPMEVNLNSFLDHS